MTDIVSKEDITALVDTFYERVKQDDTIGHIFMTVIGEDWSHHLPIMYNFWNMVLFAEPGYAGSPVKKHIDIDKDIPMNKEHFDRWTKLWNTTVDDMYQGEIADMAKNKASLMANLIHMKIEMSRSGFETLN